MHERYFLNFFVLLSGGAFIIFDELLRFDLVNSNWKNIGLMIQGVKPSRRCVVSFVEVNGALYLYGGVSEWGGACTFLFLFIS